MLNVHFLPVLDLGQKQAVALQIHLHLIIQLRDLENVHRRSARSARNNHIH